MEALVIYLIGMLIVYIMVKRFRGKAPEHNRFKDAFITFLFSLLSWISAIIIGCIWIGEHWGKEMPNWMKKIF